MEHFNLIIIPIAGIIPLLLGFIYYHPKVLGSKVASMNGEPFAIKLSLGKIALVYLLGFLLAYMLTFATVHQAAVALQLFFMDPELSDPASPHQAFINEFMTTYGDRHRSFGHGLIHGGENGFVFGIAVLGITTIFQGKPFKTIWVHLGYITLCAALVAGVICAFI